MSQWEKLIGRIYSLASDIRLEEVKKVLEHYGYKMDRPRSGSSHCVFRKPGSSPIVIPDHGRIKVKYIETVREVVETEENK